MQISTPLALSLNYEDIDLEAEFLTRSHTVTPEDILGFSNLSFDHHPLHTDDDFARTMGFDRRIAHGLYGLALMEGLKAELGLYTTTSVASLGWDNVRFKRPLYVNDAVRSRIRFISKRPASKKGRSVVTEEVALINQDGQEVIVAQHATLLQAPLSALT
jgi:acyl dehydratase